MTNPNDNSELFEIFQNQVDLDQNQDDEDEENEKEEDNSEENETDEQPEQQDEPQQPSRSDTAGTSTTQTTDSSDTAQPESGRSAPSGDPSQRGAEATSSTGATSSEKQTPPSSTVDQEGGNDPDTETGSYIQDLDDGQELDGKIILSRGASVFLLILAIIGMIGAYFIGLQTGSNTQAVENTDAVTSDGTSGDQNTTENQSGNISETADSSTNSQSGEGGTSDNGSSDSGIVAGQTYYTIGLIAYKSSQNNVQNYISAVQRSLREDANLRYVSSVQNPVGNRQIWVVVGYFKSRDIAKQKLAEIEDNLNRTDYRNNYTKDILEITSEQARKIAGS